MSKLHFPKLSRPWKLIIAGVSAVVLAAALLLIFSFSVTVRNILPQNMKVTTMELHGLEWCGYSEFHTELTEYENLLSVLRYVESIPLQPLTREPADAKEWSITIYTLNRSSYEVRFIGNEAVSFDGQLYSVKATPFFPKGTDIYNNVCKLAGDDAFSFDHASIAAGLVDVFGSEDGVYCLKDIGNIHLSDELDSYASLYGLYLLKPENETGGFVCRIPGDHTAYYDGSKAYSKQNKTTVNAEHIDAQRTGRVAEDEEYAYFGDPDNGYALSKLDLSSGEITTVVDKQSYATSLYNGKLYFLTKSEEAYRFAIAAVDTDGANLEFLLPSIYGFFFLIANDEIFFVDKEGDNKNLYSYDIQTEQMRLLLNDVSHASLQNYCFAEEHIIFTKDDMIYKLNCNDPKPILLSKDHGEEFKYVDGWIWYHSFDDGYWWKIDMDGNNKQKVFPLAEDNITIYGVTDDWVYYSEGTAREVKRSARNGSETETVMDALHENITVSPSVIFCELLPDGDLPGGFSYIITQ